jgi:predicted transposase/invertase (TIGR01784 family)
MAYLDPKNDVTFRKVFGQHPRVLISFLKALLPLTPNQQVVQIEYLPAELLPDTPELKNTIVDIRCRDAQGRQFLVEMQMLWSEHFESRVLYNACKSFSRQIGKGDDYDLLAPVYSLNIVNQAFSNQQAEWYHHFSISHQSLAGRHISGIEFVFVELPNFIPANYSEKRVTLLWLRFLKEIVNNTEMIPQELMDVPEIAEAVEALKESSYSREELEKYEKYWDIVRTQRMFLKDALKKGWMQGVEEGKAEGKVEGKAEGEQLATLKIAKKLKDNGFPIDEISKLTGLGTEEIIAI